MVRVVMILGENQGTSRRVRGNTGVLGARSCKESLLRILFVFLRNLGLL